MSEATYLIVCRDKKQFFDPYALTGCRWFENICMFDNISRALMLLTHHNNDPMGYEPHPVVSKLFGGWADGRIVTTGKNHIGKDLTGNIKLGNLYAVASERYEDITTSVIRMLARYDLYLKGELKDEDDGDDGDEQKKEMEIETLDNVRFVTKYQNGKRRTIIQEKAGEQDGAAIWKTTFNGDGIMGE